MGINKNFLVQVYVFIASSLGYLIGGGFMSGQETIQFFVPFGYQAVFVGITLGLILILTNCGFIYAGKHGGLTKGTDVYVYFCGRVIGKGFEWFTIFFCFMLYLAEIAAGGAVLNEQYGVPIFIGALITAIITALTVTIGLKSVLNSLSIITPVLAAFVIIVGVVTLIKSGANIDFNVKQITSGHFDLLRVAPNWLLSGISLSGIIILMLSAFTADLATRFEMKPLMIGHSIGLALYALLDILASFAITADIDQVAGKQIINFFLAKGIWAPLGMSFGVLIFLAIYTICTPLVHVIATKFTEEGTAKNKILIWSVTAVAFVGAVAFPFDIIINFVYKISGDAGSLIIVFMAIKFIRIYFSSKKAETPGCQ